MKKLLALTIVFLFFGMIIFPSSGIQIDNKSINSSNRGNTLYVGGNGSGNYSKIQDAIDDAVDGDTVFVYDDSSPYHEWGIEVNKSINLIGENRETTIISGIDYYSSWIIVIYKDSVNVSGFTLTNAYKGIHANYYNLIISDNHFQNCSIGIEMWLSGKDESYIISNLFTHNGIPIRIGYDNCDKQITISDNIIISSTLNYFESADIYSWWGDNYVVTNNTFICNYPDSYREGIELNSCNNSIIEGNKFTGYEYCITLYHSRNNIISHNNITNSELGVTIGIGSASNKVKNNNFINNKWDASQIIFGFNIWDGNYWDKWIGLKYKLPIFQRFPKIIRGGLLTFAIDWHPAKEPYDI